MAKKFPVNPAHPERICWGCDAYCPTDSMRCGNGSDRTAHPVELFGEDWLAWDGAAVPPRETPAPAADADIAGSAPGDQYGLKFEEPP
jgi:hypothetical protein